MHHFVTRLSEDHLIFLRSLSDMGWWVKKSGAAMNDHEHRMHKLNSFYKHNTEYTKYMTYELRNIRHKLDNVIITADPSIKFRKMYG